MRIPIALQLALLVLITSLIGLAIISIATWENNYSFVTGVKSQGLILAAALKAGEVASQIQLIQATCSTVTTRILIQAAMLSFYQGNDTSANWAAATTDVQSALGTGGYVSLYQAIIYSRNGAGDQNGLLNVTSDTLTGQIALPYTYDNGSTVMLGDPGLGYPPSLYPNLTYSYDEGVNPDDATSAQDTAHAFSNFAFNTTSVLLLGPLYLNASFSLISLTLPIINNTSNTDILGYMTVVASAASIQSSLENSDGLDSSTNILLVGPATADNRFSGDAVPATRTEPDVNKTALGEAQVRYVFMPPLVDGQDDRHSKYRATQTTFSLSEYPEVLTALETPRATTYNSTSNLNTYNEQGYNVAVGVARPQTSLVDWVLVIEETHKQAFQPVTQLRKIILACVFGTAGFIALVTIPLAHYSVTPIRKLKAATEKTIQPSMHHHQYGGIIAGHDATETGVLEGLNARSEKRGIFGAISNVVHGRWARSIGTASEDGRSKTFKVPGKVKESKHFITDELTELTATFNEMADELMIQYTRLEERVAERTRELEISKKAAETANESKTLFIANISHELKTPLNGILGMCAVCMGEDDLPRIKKSLQVVYKSGDLLLHLLNDLLTFSKNEIDSAIRLDEKEFNLSDIKSQILTIFEKQVHERHIHFSVKFIGAPNTPTDLTNVLSNDEKQALAISSAVASNHAYGPPGTGRLKDMLLWGDQHRILQVLINLVSNSLKFTPEGGRVDVRIKCLGDYERPSEGSAKISFDSRTNSAMRSRTPSFQSRQSRDTQVGASQTGGIPGNFEHYSREREPPINYRILAFTFEVEDTGPGIPPHLQQRVFEPFMQGDLGLNRKFGGTGLGLSICSQLSRLMGGTIQLDSAVGRGSTFKVDIPLKFLKEMAPSTRSSSTGAASRPQSEIVSLDETTNITRTPVGNSPVTKPTEPPDLQPRLVGLSQPFFAAAPPAQSPPINNNNNIGNITSDTKRQALHTQVASQASSTALTNTLSDTNGSTKIRVLVAEDNAVNQEVVLRMLKLEDVYDVTVAKDGQEAYDTVKAAMSEGNKFDLIFMDIQMPNLDGLQSTRLIRQMGYSAPIVALSAFAEESNIRDCMESGMDMFLSKPIRRPALKQVLKKFATIVEEEGEAAAE